MTVRARPGARPAFLLAVIVIAGLTVRVWGLTFGLPLVLARPDELLLIGIVVRFFTEGPNPSFFDYPGLHLYLLAGLYAIYYWWSLITGRIGSPADFAVSFREGWEPFFLIGRAVAAVLGTITIVLSHAIAARLFGTGAGLLAALFTALAFLHARDSHYATTDVPLTFFTMCTMLALVRVYQSGQRADARTAGLFAGLAMGTKYNAALLVVPIAAVEVLRAWDARADWRRALRESRLLTMLLLMGAVFLATSPYLLLDHERALHDLHLLQQSAASGMTPPEMLGRGWTYHLPYSLRYGLGWPLLSAALAGIALMGFRRPGIAVVLGSFPVTYYVVAGAGYNVFVRYMVPIVPFLCIFAGYFVWELAAWLARRVAIGQPVAAAALGLAIVAPSAWSVVQFNTVLSAEDSRLVAGRWMHEHARPGATIYMSGNRYGHLQLERGRTPMYRYYQFDYHADWFAEDGRAPDELPQWIVVQRSALPYSHIPDAVTRLLPKAYDLAHAVRAANLAERNFYDIQDAFYAPFGGFRGVRRPGPNIEIYRRRGPMGDGTWDMGTGSGQEAVTGTGR